MISVAEARDKLLALVQPGAVEHVALTEAAGRVLAEPVTTNRTQPPFAASAMDGYAVAGGPPEIGTTFEVVGTSAAGKASGVAISSGQAVRIFTGAVVPEGAERVIIQEDVTRSDAVITVTQAPGDAKHIRPAGADFEAGATIDAPRHLGPSDVALLAAMNIPRIPVFARPRVALIATGDELVMPGETPASDQIIASNSFGLKAMLEADGAEVRLLPIARDNLASLATAFSLAKGADLLVTIGGASVGDHDLVAEASGIAGMEQAFYKVAMRPGKPLMAGRMGKSAMIGLPGNPVSAMVCGEIFLRPVIARMSGLDHSESKTQTAVLAAPLPQANGPRAHYMRARLDAGSVRVFDRQDSALLTVLADANALAIRPPNDPPREAGAEIEVIPLGAPL